MVKIVDEISQELKREDFFNKVRQALPFIGGACILVLLGSAFYAWRAHAKEKQLERDERTYEQALVHIEKNEFDQAQPLLDTLCSSRGMGVLARMDKARIEKKDFLLTGSKKALSTIDILYRHLEKEYISLSLQGFLTLSQAFLSSSKNPDLEKKISAFLSQNNPWYPLALSWKTLNTYTNGNKKDIAPAFALWSSEMNRSGKQAPGSVGPLSWISRCATMGTLLEVKP
jgi:hypothetical protein